MNPSDEPQNMTQETPSATPAASSGRASPGERLAQARAQRGLTAEQVARETNLSLRYVQALEQDDYDVLPGPAFIRGYLRRYAQLVQLSPDTLVAVFDELWSSRAPAPVQQEPLKAGVLHAGGESLHTGRRPGFMVILSGAVLALLVVGSLFWNSGDHASDIDVVAPLEQDVTLPPSPEAPLVDPAQLVPPATPALPGDVPPAEAGTQPATTDEQPAAAPVIDALPAEPARPAASVPRPATPVTTVAPVVPANPAATPSAQGSVVIPATPAAAGPRIDTLSFTFTGRSWISVRDATGQELVYGLKNQGQVVAVTGQPPFSINIGNVKATSLSRNGQPVNLKPYTRGEIASFRLTN
ncbi:hypothetical protein C5O18_02530 [Amnimonas aquatica]|uniref:HTH cro/C1-type domain-containing protein n=2 Tax=Amnimonas aquatica TaxID=2094561 RepID=A0A2P6AU71_9GAMM|nr:hypothetical protein C5O18_02530 [Amnimonas aquatica]